MFSMMRRGWSGWSVICPVAFFAAGLAGVAYADTEVGGAISSDTLWRVANSPYRVTSPVTITSGATLSIEAGTVVYMSSGAGLSVQSGGLQAQGSPQMPVRITSYRARPGDTPMPGDWGKLAFTAGTQTAKTRLENTFIEYGQGVDISGASPVFSSVAINHHSAPAITMDLASSPAGTNVSAQGNTVNGIVVPSGVLQGTVRWGIQGIPYVLSSGRLSVGLEPSLTAVSPRSFEQGERASLNLEGVRLSGLEQLKFEPPIPEEAAILSGATPTAAGVSLNIPVNYPVGNVSLSAVTDAGEVALPNAFSVTAMQAPRITGVTPRSLVRDAETVVQVSGTSLSTASVATTAPGLKILSPSATHSSFSFRVKVDAQVAPAAYPFTLSNAAGQAAFSLEVVSGTSQRPDFSVIPTLISLAPDSVYRSVLFSAAQSAAQDRAYTVQVEDATIARVRSASFTLPAGQGTVPLALAGLKAGNTVLRISGEGLAQPLETPISVVAGGYQQTSVAPVVGVIRGETSSGGSDNRALVSAGVGVVRGNSNVTNGGMAEVIGVAVGVVVRGNPFEGGTPFVVSPPINVIRQ